MPTPLTPDEEFDALFRQGLEHHPEQPENPAAWHRMDLLLDADLRQQALRRKVLRLLGAESVLLLLLLWASWAFVDSRLGVGQGSVLAGPTPSAKAGNIAAPTGAAASRRPAATPPARPRPAAPPASNLGEQASAAAPAAVIAAGREHTAPARPLLAAGGQATPYRNRRAGRKLAGGRPLAATSSRAGTIGQQKTTGGRPIAAARAVWPRPHALALAAKPTARRPTAQAASRRADAGKTTPPAATFSAANSRTRFGRQQAFAQRRQPRQNTGKKAASRERLAAWPRPRQPAGEASFAASDAGFGTAIDLLLPRVPVPNLPFARPDSLRPVALATRFLPTDSLTPPLLRPQPYRLRLGLVAAPELSTVRTSRLSPPGPSVGVQLDYQLARRWHLSTAFLYSVKRYEAAGADYTLPYTLPHGWVITDVDAVCNIIDIPLNLRYDLWQRPRYQVFASAGLSSLFMKREQYTYDYGLVYNKPVAPYTFELSNGSQHLLKVLNLSVGYERQLSPRWSVQAESFVKLPLAGVGYGAVRLRSAGVFFSLRYGLLPGRPAPAPGLR